MALKILYTRVDGALTADISAASTLLPIDSDTLSILQSSINFGGGEWTYLTLANDLYSEEVKVTGIQDVYLIVQRQASGSTAQPFAAADTVVYDHVGADAIKDIIAANPSPSSVSVGGTGLASVSEPTTGNYLVTVREPNFSGENGIAVLGVWPNIQFAYEGSTEGCSCGGGGGSTGGGVSQVVVVSSILSASIDAATLTLTLPQPSFLGTGGVTVTGSWTEGFTFSGGGGGGTGTVVSVGAGTGLTLTGSPNTNPTLSLTATGVGAGTYGGFTFNAQGQLTGVTGGYAPLGSITFSNGADVTSTGTSRIVSLHTADVGVQGIVALADSSNPVDSGDDSTAVTPKMLAASLSGTGGSLTGAGSSNGESDGDYTNVLSNTACSVNAGQTLLVIGEVECIGADPLTPAAFGVAVFNSSSVKLYSSKKITQSKQGVLFTITPSATTTISLVTTALAAGVSVSSSFLAVLRP